MIRKAKISEIDALTSLVSVCGEHMRKNGIHQWLEGYPSRVIIETDIKEETLFVLEENGVVKSMVVLNEKQDPEYQDLNWLTSENSKNLIVHRLATLPNLQGQGLGSKMMSFAEDYAEKKGFSSIRLDTFTQNKGNLKFYDKRGYTNVGEVNLSYRDDYPYVCFELVFHSV